MLNGKNILCLIPVRSGSKGLKNKNIRQISGKPLLEYALKASIGAKCVTDVCVSSDSDEILSLCHDSVIKIKRPKELSKDESTSHSAIFHAMSNLEKKNNMKYDYGVIVQATNPLVISKDIDGVIKLLVGKKLDSCISIVEVEGFDLAHYFSIESDSILQPISGKSIDNFKRRQDLAKTYKSNGSCFAASRETIMSGKLLGSKCGGFLVDKKRYIDIDDEYDLELANLILKERINE